MTCICGHVDTDHDLGKCAHCPCFAFRESPTESERARLTKKLLDAPDWDGRSLQSNEAWTLVQMWDEKAKQTIKFVNDPCISERVQ